MFRLREPTAAEVAAVVAVRRRFNYEVGSATLERPPRFFFRNQTVVTLGSGDACWRSAVAAMGAWRMGQLGWCDFLAPVPPAAGQVVVARARHWVFLHWGFWSLHPSRIVHLEQTRRSYQFTIRTLEGHDECGEERFALDFLPTGEVQFAIRSYSRPARLAGWLALPYVRHLQARFGREAALVMQRLTA